MKDLLSVTRVWQRKHTDFHLPAVIKILTAIPELAGRKKTLTFKVFALIIQTISTNFAHIKSNPDTWDFLTGLHKK
jgi:hypothetical protein